TRNWTIKTRNCCSPLIAPPNGTGLIPTSTCFAISQEIHSRVSPSIPPISISKRAAWLRLPTTNERHALDTSTLPASLSSPTPWTKRAAPKPPSALTSAAQAPTCEDVGRWIWYWANSEFRPPHDITALHVQGLDGDQPVCQFFAAQVPHRSLCRRHRVP